MTRSMRPLMLLVCGGLALAACKKDEDPQAVPVPSGTAAAPAPAPSPAAEATATATATAAPPPVAAPPAQRASIDACCSALAAVAKSGRGADAKAKSAQAAKICPGIAKLVKEGTTQRASALTQIRSALVGVEVPPECK